jgi:hypothetical protein
MQADDSTPRGTEPLTFAAAADRLALLDFDGETTSDGAGTTDHPSAARPPSSAAAKSDAPAHADDRSDDVGAELAPDDPRQSAGPDDAAEDAADAAVFADAAADARDSDEREADESLVVRLRDGTRITVAELKKGYGREADYTRKTQELAEQKKAVESRQTQLSQHEQFFTQAAEHAVRVARAFMPKPPDASLRDSDPVEYFLQKDRYDRAEAHVRSLESAQAAQADRAAHEQGELIRDHLATQQKLLIDKVPEFRSEKARRAFWDEALAVAHAHYGYSADEMSQVHDHRLMLVLKDALAYRRLQASKPKAEAKVKEAPPVAQPAKRPTRNEREAQRFNEQVGRLRQTGDFDTAVSILSRFD